MDVSAEERERLLVMVQEATDRREVATADQRAAILAAHSAGVPVAHIARSARLSREYIYRIVRASEE